MKKYSKENGFESYAEVRLYYAYLKCKSANVLSELKNPNLKKLEDQIFNKMEQNKVEYDEAVEKLYSHYDNGVGIVDKYLGKGDYNLLYTREEKSLLLAFDRKQKVLFDKVKRIRGKALFDELNKLEYEKILYLSQNQR